MTVLNTKTLYALVANGGDGSYNIRYTFNKAWIEDMDRRYDDGELEHDAVGCDGDGFHYDELTLPIECTLESMGCGGDVAED